LVHGRNAWPGSRFEQSRPSHSTTACPYAHQQAFALGPTQTEALPYAISPPWCREVTRSSACTYWQRLSHSTKGTIMCSSSFGARIAQHRQARRLHYIASAPSPVHAQAASFRAETSKQDASQTFSPAPRTELDLLYSLTSGPVALTQVATAYSHALHPGTPAPRQHWPRAPARAPTRRTRHILVGEQAAVTRRVFRGHRSRLQHCAARQHLASRRLPTHAGARCDFEHSGASTEHGCVCLGN
jgi:hypothetical protein